MNSRIISDTAAHLTSIYPPTWNTNSICVTRGSHTPSVVRGASPCTWKEGYKHTTPMHLSDSCRYLRNIAIFISTSIWDLIWLTLLLLLPLMLILWPHLTGSGLTSGTGRQVSLLRKIKMIHFMLMRTSAKYVEERAATRATRPYLFFTSEQEVWNTRRRRLSPSYPARAAGARGASTQLGKYTAG